MDFRTRPFRETKRRWLICVAFGLTGCASTSTRTIELEEISATCPSEAEWLDHTQVVEIDRNSDPVRPDAIGFWHMECPPGAAMPGGHYGVPSFVWDGRYVTMVMPNEDDVSESVHRVVGDWDGDWLSVSMPNGRIYRIGRFVGARFQQERRGEVIPYRRSEHPLRYDDPALLRPPPVEE